MVIYSEKLLIVDVAFKTIQLVQLGEHDGAQRRYTRAGPARNESNFSPALVKKCVEVDQRT